MENVFSHTAGTRAQGVVLSHVLSIAFLLSAIADRNFRAGEFFWGLSPIPFVVFLCCTMSAKKIRSKSQSGGIFIFYDSSETLLHYWQEILGLQKIYLLGILDFKFFIHKFLVWVYTRNDVSHVFFTDLTELCKIIVYKLLPRIERGELALRVKRYVLIFANLIQDILPEISHMKWW